MATMKPTMTTAEAAETMNVHHKTVEDLIHAGVLPAGKLGRAWVLKTSDVLKYVDQEIQRQTADRLRGLPRRRVGRDGLARGAI